MTAPFIAEAERAAAEAIAEHEVVLARGDLTQVCSCGFDFDPCHFGDPWSAHLAAAAVAAVVPILAEHFAQAVEEGSPDEWTARSGAYQRGLVDGWADAARVIREAATPAEVTE